MDASLKIGDGASATVSVIDCAKISNLPLDPYFLRDVSRLQRTTIPTFSFLVTNQANRRVLFDLGLRKDWQRLAPGAVAEIHQDELDVECKEDVRDILEKHGHSVESIEAIVLSHHHFDHIGDPSRFPSATRLVVGPGFVRTLVPGFPDADTAEILSSDYLNRDLDEVDFQEGRLSIAGMSAVDYFGDGSFYLLYTPGHTIGHMSGLVRTSSTPSTFVLLGGDACHHCGELRPSPWRQVPHEAPYASEALVYLDEHANDGTRPFFAIQRDPKYAAYCHNPDEAEATIDKIQTLDACDYIFPVFSHDATLKGMIDEFPATLNDWMAKSWGERGRWAFLADIA